MHTTIDAAGRIVVPKAMRDAMGLAPGVAVVIAVRDGALVIEPAPTPMRLIKRGKGLVAQPAEPLPPLTAADVRATLEGTRR